jgi:hypothetical protein
MEENEVFIFFLKKCATMGFIVNTARITMAKR